MIKYEWRNDFDADESRELAGLLSRAADFDAEPEYSTIEFDAVESAVAQSDPTVRHLVIWMLPRSIASGGPDDPERIAGLLRLVHATDSVAEATVVIDPALRSIGITTLLLEQVGVETANMDGWMGTGARTVTAWARGNHPAAGRISARFLIPRTSRLWKLICPAGTVETTSAAAVLEPVDPSLLEELGWADGVQHGDRVLALREDGVIVGLLSVDLRPVGSAEFGTCATITQVARPPRTDTGALRRLLAGAAGMMHEAGLHGLVVYVDSGDAELVNACRLAGFQHDRTDVRYQLGGPTP